jgi:ABC-type transporter Mla subunit MlaD
MTDEATQAFAAAFGAEHQELRRLLHALQPALGSDHPWSRESARELQARLQDLETCLQRHFAQEESGGYLEEALALAPRFSAQASRLLAQHAELLGKLRQALEQAFAAVESPAAWQDLQFKTTTFIKELLAHEADENKIVQRAFNTDLGMAD